MGTGVPTGKLATMKYLETWSATNAMAATMAKAARTP